VLSFCSVRVVLVLVYFVVSVLCSRYRLRVVVLGLGKSWFSRFRLFMVCSSGWLILFGVVLDVRVDRDF